MAQLSYNEIKEKKVILFNEEPCIILESHVARTQQRKPQNQVKLRSMMSGKTFNATFHVSDSADEADIAKRDVKFLYHNKGEYWFADPTDPKNRFKLEEVLLADAKKFLKENMLVSAMVFTNEDEEEKVISVELPIKVEFTVKEAPPAVRGDTSKGGNKVIVLENGSEITAPMFINPGDKILVNTVTGEYSERA
jgi:elongation factor P